jgi:small-conductance mechanosensitive channel
MGPHLRRFAVQFSKFATSLILLPSLMAQTSGGSTAKATPVGSTAVASASQAAGSTQAAASSSASTTAPAALQQQIAKLPPLTNTGLDAGARSQDVLAHLNAVMRFYRAAVLPIQTVGEPSDVLYSEQSASEATQIAQFAFQAAKNEATLLSKVQGAPQQVAGQNNNGTNGNQQGQQSESQRLASIRARTAQQIADLQARDDALDKQIATAKAKDLPTLRQQKEQLEGGIELQKTIAAALGRLSASDASVQQGLAGDIDRLQRSAPELLNGNAKSAPPQSLESLTSAREAGVVSQATVMFQLLSTRRSIDDQIAALDQLRQQATDLRAPILQVLRKTVQQGQALSQQAVDLAATPTSDAEDLANTRKSFDELTATFQLVSGVTVPLGQEIVLLEQDRGTLSTWRSTVDTEYKTVMRRLLLRVAGIAIALGVLFLLSQIWSRATIRYVKDLRRRRQLLVVRRVVVGFLSGLVLIFGFVTQFSSLATFAGFITAGIAVGLQTILLSVAAYFFIIGRYGVRVGDRITVSGVTGDVIEVGLARFYMTELVGSGTELHSTGRVAVFANSVLFQTGTPLYKQMPGTEYAWHELTVKLNPGVDTKKISDAVLRVVNDVFGTYCERIDQQHQQVEAWMGTALEPAKVDMRLQLAEAGLQIAVLFPVEIRRAAEVDQQIAEGLLKLLGSDEQIKTGVAGVPVIKAAIKS